MRIASLELWQIDITKYPYFGKLKNIHVPVDTLSVTVYASLHTGDIANYVCQCFLQDLLH